MLSLMFPQVHSHAQATPYIYMHDMILSYSEVREWQKVNQWTYVK